VIPSKLTAGCVAPFGCLFFLSTWCIVSFTVQLLLFYSCFVLFCFVLFCFVASLVCVGVCTMQCSWRSNTCGPEYWLVLPHSMPGCSHWGTATVKMRQKQWFRRCLILLKLLGKGTNARLIDLSSYLWHSILISITMPSCFSILGEALLSGECQWIYDDTCHALNQTSHADNRDLYLVQFSFSPSFIVRAQSIMPGKV